MCLASFRSRQCGSSAEQSTGASSSKYRPLRRRPPRCGSGHGAGSAVVCGAPGRTELAGWPAGRRLNPRPRSAVHWRGSGARSSTDRASDYGSEGWGFESLRARQVPQVTGSHPRAGTFLFTLGKGRRLTISPRSYPTLLRTSGAAAMSSGRAWCRCPHSRPPCAASGGADVIGHPGRGHQRAGSPETARCPRRAGAEFGDLMGARVSSSPARRRSCSRKS